jgi:hypothetical protein
MSLSSNIQDADGRAIGERSGRGFREGRAGHDGISE